MKSDEPEARTSYLQARSVSPDEYIELWKYFSQRADELKDRRWTVCTWLLGIGVAVVGFWANATGFTGNEPLDLSVYWHAAFIFALLAVGGVSALAWWDFSKHINRNQKRSEVVCGLIRPLKEIINCKEVEETLHPFKTARVGTESDHLAPDGSEIRLLPNAASGGLCHCTLPPGSVSQAVKHKTVEEIWYFVEGRGEVWRKLGDNEETTPVEPGVCLTIPVGTHFQFRSTGDEPLRFLIATMPPWPGEDEAVKVAGKW